MPQTKTFKLIMLLQLTAVLVTAAFAIAVAALIFLSPVEPTGTLWAVASPTFIIPGAIISFLALLFLIRLEQRISTRELRAASPQK